MRHFALNLFTTVLAFSVVSVAHAADLIQWAPNFDQALSAAKQQNKLLLIHFWTPDCGPCKVVDRKVFPSPAVAQAINENYIPLKVNAYQKSDLRIHFGVEQWPTDIVSTVDGRAVHRMVTPQDPAHYTDVLASVARQHAPDVQAQPGMVAQKFAGSSPMPPYQPSTEQKWASNIEPPEIAESGARARRPGIDPAMRPGVGVSRPGPGYSGDRVNQFGYGPIDAPTGGFASRYQQAPTTANGQTANTQAAPPREFANRYANATPSSSASGSSSANVANPHFAGSDQRAAPVDRPQQRVVAAQSGQKTEANLNARESQNAAARQFAVAPPQRQSVPDSGPSVTSVQESASIGLDGRCPVTLVADGKWRQGDPRWGAIHRGKTYLFAGPKQQQDFLADPDLYSPVLAGMDVVRLAENGSVVQGTRRFGVLFDDDGEAGPRKSRIYLFDSVDSRNRFEAEPDRFLQPVMQARQHGGLDTLLR